MIIGRKKVAKTDLHSHHESLPATAETFKYVLDQKTPGIKYFPIQPSHWVNTNKIHEFLTPNNSHSSLLNNLPINLSSKRLGPCKLGHVVFCSYLPHVCPLEQHCVCPMTLGKHNLQPWLPHLVAYKMLFFFVFLFFKTKPEPVNEIYQLRTGILIYKNRMSTNNNHLIHSVKLDQKCDFSSSLCNLSKHIEWFWKATTKGLECKHLFGEHKLV